MKKEKIKSENPAQGQIQGVSPINVLATRVPGVFALSDDEFWQLIGEFCNQLPLNEDVVAQLKDRQPVMTLHVTKGHIMPGSGTSVVDGDQEAQDMFTEWTGSGNDDLTPLCDDDQKS